MLKYKHTIVFLLLLGLTFSNQVSAETWRCESTFLPGLSLDYSLVSQQGYFLRLTEALPRVPNALWKRYWNDPVTLNLQRHLLEKIAGESQRFEIKPHGDFITKTLLLEDHLFLDLVHIRAYSDGSGLKVGERAKGVNTLFLKTMTAFLRSSASLIQTNPQIKYVVIRGVNLKNPMLIDFLTENGFERSDLHSYSKDFEKTISIF